MIWSEGNSLSDDGVAEMEMSVREDFNRFGMGDRRAELIQRLDVVLEKVGPVGAPFTDHSEPIQTIQEDITGGGRGND